MNDFRFDPLDDAFIADPWPVFKRARQEYPIYKHADMHLRPISITRYEDVEAILKDYTTFSSDMGAEYRDKDMKELNTFVHDDPPRHTELRAIFTPIFSPAYIRQLDYLVEEYCNKLLNELIGLDEFDLVEDFAGPLTTFLISHLLGTPPDPRMRSWTTRVEDTFMVPLFAKEETTEAESVLVEVLAEMGEFFSHHLAARESDSGDDIVSRLIQSGLPRQDVLALAKAMVFGGNGTTTNMINHMVKLLIDHPSQEAVLRENPEFVVNAIEEALRLESTVPILFRRVTNDTEFKETQFEKDQFIAIWPASANRDESVIDRPDVFDVTRPRVRHLAFGRGIHTCIGNPLARLEMRIALQGILKLTSEIERTREEMPPIRAPGVYGFKHQYVRFHAA